MPVFIGLGQYGKVVGGAHRPLRLTQVSSVWVMQGVVVFTVVTECRTAWLVACCLLLVASKPIPLPPPKQWERHWGPSQEAERRYCYGGGEAGRRASRDRAKDGPSRRAPITVPERRHRASLGELGRMVGQGLFAYFCGCLTKVSRRKGGTRRKSKYIQWICTQAN